MTKTASEILKDPQIAAMVAEYVAASTCSAVWSAHVKLEGVMNQTDMMGQFRESRAIRAELNRLAREVAKPVCRAEAAKVKTYTLAELRERSAAIQSIETEEAA